MIYMNQSSIRYSTSPESNNDQLIERRGIRSGFISVNDQSLDLSAAAIQKQWTLNNPIYLPKMILDKLPEFDNEINHSKQLYHSVLEDDEIEANFDEDYYLTLLGERFEILSSRVDESDQQEIVSIDFDVMQEAELLYEDIWMRISWLSFHEEDESLRFRFSFGMENFEDVSKDPERQWVAAELCEAIFPESKIISENEKLISFLESVLSLNGLIFVERIVYFNAPNGGALFHHDAEKGHLGVVYAQLTGETLWLSLSRESLINEIQLFISRETNLKDLKILFKSTPNFTNFIEKLKVNAELNKLLDDPSNEEISILLNESQLFVKQLIEAGHAYVLSAGDIILLPQSSLEHCAWHSVFTLGDTPGEALSFAIKPKG